MLYLCVCVFLNNNNIPPGFLPAACAKMLFLRASSFLCFGGGRIYFGILVSASLVSCGGAPQYPPPPPGLMWPTFMAGTQTQCVRQSIGSSRLAAQRCRAAADYLGFHRLHNLDSSLIHCNYLIYLLCNQHIPSLIYPTSRWGTGSCSA